MDLIHISQPRLNSDLVSNFLSQGEASSETAKDNCPTTKVYKSKGTLQIKLPINQLIYNLDVIVNEIITDDHWRYVEISTNIPLQWHPEAFEKLKQLDRDSSQRRKLLIILNRRIAIQIDTDQLLDIEWEYPSSETSHKYAHNELFRRGSLQIEDDRFHGRWQLEFILHGNFFCLDRIVFSEQIDELLQQMTE